MTTKPHVLCVDDEPAVLDGLELTLGRKFRTTMATSGAAALDILEGDREFAVIVSDMRMPQMDGAALLARARVLVPDATRVLLTGHSDMKSAISAINEGQIFRFLTKPCEPTALLAAIEAACEQHRLITSEHVLLEHTLQGSIKALVEALAIVNPVAFGRAGRIRKTAMAVAGRLNLADRWQLEVAAMLWPLGLIAVSTETAEKLFYGRPLDDRERESCAHAPAVVEQLIGHIPRLEGVRAILASVASPYRATAIQPAAAVLRAAIDLDTLEIQGMDCQLAIATLQGRHEHEPAVLAALAEVRAPAALAQEVRELPLAALRPGMVFAEDVKLATGALLVARGAEVSPSFLARVANFPDGVLSARLRVLMPADR